MHIQVTSNSIKKTSHCIVIDAHTVAPIVVKSFAEISGALHDYCHVWLSLSGSQTNNYLDHFPDWLRSKIIFLTDEEIFDAIPHQKAKHSVTPGNVDLKLLATERRLEQYNFSHIIRIEYDVFCIQPLRETFERLCEWAINYDLGGSSLRRLNESNANWHWWQSLEAPLTREPLDGSEPFVPSALFFPILCASVRFLKNYSVYIQSGWKGHYETLMPTVASLLDMRVGDLSVFPNRFTWPKQFAPISKNALQKSGLTTLELNPAIPFVHPIKTLDDRIDMINRLRIRQKT